MVTPWRCMFPVDLRDLLLGDDAEAPMSWRRLASRSTSSVMP